MRGLGFDLLVGLLTLYVLFHLAPIAAFLDRVLAQ